MIACFGRKVGKEFESGLVLPSQSRSLRVYPQLKLAAVSKMKSVQERPLIVADRRGPLTCANRFLELPFVSVDKFRIQPEFSSCREYEIASESVSDRVYRLIEGVPRKRARAFRPEVGFDPVASETLPGAKAEDGEQTQRPFLLRDYRDGTFVSPQGKRSQKL